MESTKQNDQNTNTTAESLVQGISKEPAHKEVLCKILTYCREERNAEDILIRIKELARNRVLLQTPQSLVTWLIHEGGLETVIFDGNRCVLKTTEEGIAAVDHLSPSDLIERVIDKEPDYREVFFNILEACLEPKSKNDIETMLEEYPVIKDRGIYPGFFIGELEDAGGLEWIGKWKTTDNGKELVLSQAG